MLGGEKGSRLRADSLEYSFEDASKGWGSIGTFDKLWVFLFGMIDGNWGLLAVELTTLIGRESPMSAFESVVVSICLPAAVARSLIRARAATLADGDG